MNASYLLLCITTATALGILLASFNENVHVQARVYEEKAKEDYLRDALHRLQRPF